MRPRFYRVVPANGRLISIWLEGEAVDAWEGESLFAAILSRRDSLPGAGPDGARRDFA